MHKVVCLFALCAGVTILFSQEPQAGPPGPPKPGGHPSPKNLKILKPEELMPKMKEFKTALGVECSFCHVKDDFASDDKMEKQIARVMFTMTRDINSKFPDGKDHVACYTCHRGDEHPKMSPDSSGEEHEQPAK